MMDDDAQLLRRYVTDRSEEAFAELVRRHLGMVYGSALRRLNGNAALTEEVAQGVFTSLARDAEVLAEKAGRGAALAGWLYVATRNAAANVLRAEVRRARREQEVFAMSNSEMTGRVGGTAGAGGVADANESEVWAQVRPELEAVMDELGAVDREAVLLRFFEGRAFGEIGAALRVSEDAARVRVNRALEKMRGLLEKRGVTSTAAALGGLLAGNAAVAAPMGMAASVTGVALAGGALTTGALAAGGMGAGVAVAGGAGAVGGGAGILSFMTTTKLVTGLACVVAAVAVGTAVWQHAELRGVRAGILAKERDKDAAMKRAVELERHLSEAEQRRQAAEKAGEEARKALAEATSKSKAASGASAKSSVAQGLDLMNRLYADEGFQAAALKMFQTTMPFKYAPFYRKMGLSAEKIADVEKALIAREQAQIDRNAAARSQKMSISDPALKSVNADGFAEAYAELRRVLGEEGLKKFTAYDQAVGTQDDVGKILVASLYSNAPLRWISRIN